jgi:hypothetical protein
MSSPEPNSTNQLVPQSVQLKRSRREPDCGSRAKPFCSRRRWPGRARACTAPSNSRQREQSGTLTTFLSSNGTDLSPSRGDPLGPSPGSLRALSDVPGGERPPPPRRTRREEEPCGIETAGGTGSTVGSETAQQTFGYGSGSGAPLNLLPGPDLSTLGSKMPFIRSPLHPGWVRRRPCRKALRSVP